MVHMQLGALLFVCLLLTPLPGCYAVQLSGSAFRNIAVSGSCDSFTSAQALLPGAPITVDRGLRPKICNVWRITTSSLLSHSQCAQPDSVLLLEFWATSWMPASPSAAQGPLQLADGLYMLVAKNVRPEVNVSSDGKLVQQRFPRFHILRDHPAIKERRPYHRVVVRLAEDALRAEPDWYVTIGNLNQYMSLKEYSLRASCHQPDALPCPSATPGAGPCSNKLLFGQCMNTALSGSSASTRALAQPSCACAEGHTGFACSHPLYRNLSAAGAPNTRPHIAIGSQPLLIPMPEPRSWTYIWAQLPPGPDPSLLVELSQPPGTGALLDPILVVQAARVLDLATSTVREEPVPSLLNITFVKSSKYLEIKQNYAFVSVKGKSSEVWIDAVWIAILNAAPLRPGQQQRGPHHSLSGEMPARAAAVRPTPLTLRVQADGGSAAGFACPRDCSGRGTCVKPPADRLVSYQCLCDPGYSGPWCQGVLAEATLDMATRSYSPGSAPWINLGPGQWMFHYINLGDSLKQALAGGMRASLSVSLQVQRTSLTQPQVISQARDSAGNGQAVITNQQLPDHVYLMVSPYSPATSFGEDFYSEEGTSAMMGDAVLKLPLSDLDAPGVMLAVFNSELDTSEVAAVRLHVMWMPTADDPAAEAPASITWITICIAILAGAVMLLLCGVLLGRLALRGRRDSELIIPGAPPPHVNTPKGLSNEVIASFPLVQFASPQQLDDFIADVIAELKARTASSTPLPQQCNTASRVSSILASCCVPSARAEPAHHAAHESAQPAVIINPLTTHEWWRDGSQLHAGGQVQAPAEDACVLRDPTRVAGSSQMEPHHDTPWHDRHSTCQDAPSCSICISELQVGEVLRVLLPCAHAFHQVCIDPWLEVHHTCPICRTNLLTAVKLHGLTRSTQAVQGARQRGRKASTAVPSTTPGLPSAGHAGQVQSAAPLHRIGHSRSVAAAGSDGGGVGSCQATPRQGGIGSNRGTWPSSRQAPCDLQCSPSNAASPATSRGQQQSSGGSRLASLQVQSGAIDKRGPGPWTWVTNVPLELQGAAAGPGSGCSDVTRSDAGEGELSRAALTAGPTTRLIHMSSVLITDSAGHSHRSSPARNRGWQGY